MGQLIWVDFIECCLLSYAHAMLAKLSITHVPLCLQYTNMNDETKSVLSLLDCLATSATPEAFISCVLDAQPRKLREACRCRQVDGLRLQPRPAAS